MANVRWKDKTDIGAASSLAADDRMPMTDTSDTDTDKYYTPDDMATYFLTAATGSATIWVPAVAMQARTTNGAAACSARNSS